MNVDKASPGRESLDDSKGGRLMKGKKASFNKRSTITGGIPVAKLQTSDKAE